MTGVQGEQAGLLTIGQVARRSGLSVKALRHYDRVRLLCPAAVDGGSGYRLYRSDQVGEAQLVHLLRSLDLPLEQVRAAVAAWKAGDAGTLSEVIRLHRRHLDARVTRLRGALHRIDHLLAEGLKDVMTGLETTAETATTKSPPGTGSVTDARLLAAQLFNETWRLMEQEKRTRPDDDRMVHIAHASRYHWGQVPAITPAHLARGEWLISRVYAVLGRPEPPCTTPAGSWSCARRTASATGTWPSPTRHWPAPTPSPGTRPRPGTAPIRLSPPPRTSPRTRIVIWCWPTWKPCPGSRGLVHPDAIGG